MPRDAPWVASEAKATPKDLDYYCAQCGALVTRGRWEIAMNGAHEHVLFNPAGILFRILCFKEAPGAEAVGTASAVFTWFKGYRWRIALCAACAAHLGWVYEGSQAPRVFFGLIKAALRSKRTGLTGSG